MPYAPLRPCSHPGCPRLVARGRCPDHQRQADARDRAERGDARARGYDGRWKRLRDWHLSQFPTCACGAPAVDVHHRVSVREDPSLRLDPGNLVSVCHACHMATHARESGR